VVTDRFLPQNPEGTKEAPVTKEQKKWLKENFKNHKEGAFIALVTTMRKHPEHSSPPLQKQAPSPMSSSTITS
jgi:hypothetical protein